MSWIDSVLRRHNLEFRWRVRPVRRATPIQKPLAALPVASLASHLRYNTDLRLKSGLTIVGHVRSELGLGQAARCLARASDSVRLPCSFHHLPVPNRENEPEFDTKSISMPDRKANLLVFGLPTIVGLTDEIRGGRHNILYPFWELAKIDEAWLPLIKRCSEVWAPSTFVADMFKANSRLPAELVRQPLNVPQRALNRVQQDRPLTFLTYFDYNSFGERKNPQAALNAFRLAFPRGSEDVRLVIKTRGSDDQGLRAWLTKESAVEPRLHIIDRTVDRAAMNQLLDECHAFVSLHRSEGFGFGAAEALVAGKAVISTDYSGTTDFINSDTGYPIGYKLVPVPDGAYLSSDQQVWADPDLDHAAHAMKSIYDDYDGALAKGVVGHQLMKDQHSFEVIGNQMRALLADRGLI